MIASLLIFLCATAIPDDVLQYRINSLVCRIDYYATRVELLKPRYQWGAAGPDLFDCSGFASWVCQRSGCPVKRETAMGIWLGRGGWGIRNSQDRAKIFKSSFPDLIFIQNVRPADHVGLIREVTATELIFAEAPNKRNLFRRTKLTKENYYGKHYFGKKSLPLDTWCR